ncbi:MAG: glycosyltransferase family 4 protein [Candidatus Micrarchaeia archaeon]
MNIVFFSLAGTFDYFQIGGTDSFVRRITKGLLNLDNNLYISWIFYNSKEEKEIKHLPNFASKYFKNLKDALDYIYATKPEHVIACYIKPQDRILFAKFRNLAKNICFHSIPFFYPHSSLKRFLKFFEYFIFPYNGKIFCVSKRQYEYIKKFAKHVVYLLPPVPESYFLTPEEKPINERINIAFIGRIDPRKGIKEVIEIFTTLKKNDRFDLTIYGIHIPWDKEGLKIHNWLSNQKEIKYISFDRQKYSEKIESRLIEILKTTDIIILPYKTLDSSIDTPLLLLESMASLCVVLTTPVGDIPEIYGQTRLVIPIKKFVSEAIKILSNISTEEIKKERKRIYTQNQKLNFNSSYIIEKFYNSLQDK